MRYRFAAATRTIFLVILLTLFNTMAVMAEQEDYRRPDFSLPDLDGVERSISEWDGKALIINFWASWCIPCLREIPLLNQLSAEYADKDLQILGIAVDSPENVRKFLQNTSMDYLTLVEEKRSIEVANAFSNSYLMLPFTVYLDHEGRILWMQVEEVHREQIEPVLDQIWKIRSGESTYEQAQDELIQYFGGMNLE
jgi:thiol-disulfide isomerase/thioredoxin